MSIIYGERVRLRAVEPADVERFLEWVNDPDVTRNLALYLPMSSVEEQRWFERLADRDPHERPFSVEVREGEAWTLIGNCCVFGIDWVSRSGELGIMIGAKKEWDRGYGTEVMTLLLSHCFQTLNLHRVALRVYAGNARAIRSYQKAGFQEEGRMRQARFQHGAYDDVILMSVLRPEWPAPSKES